MTAQDRSADDCSTDSTLGGREMFKAAAYASVAVATPFVVRGVAKDERLGPYPDRLETDVLVIGGGGAGIFAALHAREAGMRVTLIDKGTVGCSGLSPWAGGVHIFDPDSGDRAAWHEAIAHLGEYLNNRVWLDLYLDQSRAIFERLRTLGVLTGNIVERGRILRELLLERGVILIERVMVTTLLRGAGGAVAGAVGFTYDDSHAPCKAVVANSRVVVLCTGPATFKAPGFPAWGQTGDGDALAYEVGAAISGKEFADTHVTFARHPADVWGGWGASMDRFVGGAGTPQLQNPFMLDLTRFFQAAEGVTDTLGTGGPPGSHGSPGGPPDPRSPASKRPPPPPPATGPYSLGPPEPPVIDFAKLGTRMVGGATNGMSPHKAEGVFCADDTGAAEGVRGLYAAGDALCSMLLGTTYSMGGTSYLGSCQQGDHVARHAVEYVRRTAAEPLAAGEVERALSVQWAARERTQGYTPQWVSSVLRNAMMPYHVLYVKSGERMLAALTMVEYLRNHCVPKLVARNGHELRLAHETAHMLLNAELKLRAGLFRTESRGTHYREDFPSRDDDAWLAWVKLRKVDGRMQTEKELIPAAWRPAKVLDYRQKYPRVFPGEEAFIATRAGLVSGTGPT